MSATVPKCRCLVLGIDFTDGVPSLSQSKEAVWQLWMGSAIHSVLGNRTVRHSEEICPLLGLKYVSPLSRSIWSCFIDANPASGCPAWEHVVKISKVSPSSKWYIYTGPPIGYKAQIYESIPIFFQDLSSQGNLISSTEHLAYILILSVLVASTGYWKQGM